jgi:hypothetical protein
VDLAFLSFYDALYDLQRLTFQWHTVAPSRPEFFDDLEVRILFDPGDEPEEDVLRIRSTTTAFGGRIGERVFTPDEAEVHPRDDYLPSRILP